MDMTATQSTSLSATSVASQRTEASSSKTSANFAAALGDQLQLKKEKVADYVSGSIGVDINNRGMPSRFVFFDGEGNVLTKRPFTAPALLDATDKFNIPLSDLEGLGAQLDADNIGYRPYELYGRSSDHGLDFQDLMSGGLGTAYDWRVDNNAHLKGPSALRSLQKANDLADRLGLAPNPDVTNIGHMYGAGPKPAAEASPVRVSSNSEAELMSTFQNLISNLSNGQKANFLQQLKLMDASQTATSTSGRVENA